MKYIVLTRVFDELNYYFIEAESNSKALNKLLEKENIKTISGLTFKEHIRLFNKSMLKNEYKIEKFVNCETEENLLEF